MRRAFLSVVLCSCGLTARGSAPREDGGTPDANADAADAGALDAAADEAAALPCEVEVTESFTTTELDPTKWLTSKNVANTVYPQPYFPGDGSRLLAMLDPTAQNARGSAWYRQLLPFTAFDIELDVFAVCNASPCGDGLAIVWLEESTPAQLDDAATANTLGIPRGRSGGAVTLELTSHQLQGDGTPPNLAILDIDKTREPGNYDWTVTFDNQDYSLVNEKHRLALSLRNKQVSIKLDGVAGVQGVMSNLPAEGLFGFTAASGSWTGAFYVADVRAKFYRCNAD